MKGKVCLVTGATSGLGKATAKKLAALDATVVLGCRDRGRGETTLAEIKIGDDDANIELLPLDLSIRQSVRDAAKEFRSRHDRLDVLINNAAVFKAERTVTSDGFETMFETNHLGPFLLTNLLLGVLKSSQPARILNISAPSTTRVDFGELLERTNEEKDGKSDFGAYEAFGASKTCNLLFTYELARRLDGSGVTCNAIYPGLVRSSLMRESNPVIRILYTIISASPEAAAEDVVYFASSDEVQGTNGKFFKGRKVIESFPYSRDPEVQRRLWDISLQLTNMA